MVEKNSKYFTHFKATHFKLKTFRWTIAGVQSFLMPVLECGDIGQLTFFEEVSFLVDLIKGIVDN